MVKRAELLEQQKLELEARTSLWNTPDVFEYLTYAILIVFFICVFQNITFIGSSDLSERILATQYLAIAALGSAGLVMRAIYDQVPIRSADGQIIAIGYTKTVHEKGLKTVGNSIFYFAIAFGVQTVMSFVIMSIPLSVYGEVSIQYIVMGVISAVGEEMFFSYFATGLLLTRLKWGAIPVVSLVFVWYHWAVYQTITALLLVGVMRIVYSIVYLFSRRLSSVMLAHVLHNFLAGIRL
ncbi:MAG: CPBP family intramembrane glutamic endopeptidase [Candidatus Helarchaeota archaeon]